MAVAIPQLLNPAIVNARVDRLKVTNTSLQNAWGMNKGGSAVRQSPMGRRGSYDIFNSTRRLARPSAPMTAASLIEPFPVGNVNFIIPRFHPSMYLGAEMLHNLRPIGGPVGTIDTAGLQYVADQEKLLKQTITNQREFQIAAMQRGSYTLTNTTPLQGMTPAYSGGDITVDYQIPSGNKTKLNMLGAGDIIATKWSNSAALIISDILQVHEAFIQLTGYGLEQIDMTSVGWGYLGSNTQAVAHAGTSNTYFEYITRDDSSFNFSAKLKALPWLRINVNDNGLESGTATAISLTSGLSAAFQKFIEDDHALFTIERSAVLAQYWECGEPISEYDGQPQQVRTGEYYWVTPRSNPTGYQIFALHNGLPVLMIPAGIAYGLIEF